jgi:alpha-amylase
VHSVYLGSAKRAIFYTDGTNVIAFCKDAKGWAAFNNGTEAREIRVQTGLPAGTYCDIIHDKDSGKACDGPKVVVTSSGLATVIVAAKDAVAFTRADRISSLN